LNRLHCQSHSCITASFVAITPQFAFAIKYANLWIAKSAAPAIVDFVILKAEELQRYVHHRLPLQSNSLGFPGGRVKKMKVR
jgi:hypothetical protein